MPGVGLNWGLPDLTDTPPFFCASLPKICFCHPDRKGATVARKPTTEPPPVRAVGTSVPLPEGLGEAGSALWTRTWADTPWLTEADHGVVLLLAESEDERQALRAGVMADTGTWRDRVALRQLDAQIRAYLTLLGMTPMARHRLGASARTGPTSVLDELRAKRDRPPR